MAVMGFRLAQRANGVSQLHGQVSREMFNGLWPGFDEAEVPISSITNGVHAPDLGGPRGHRAGRASRGADPDADDVDAGWSARRQGARHRDLGGQARAARSGSSTTPGGGWRVVVSSAASPRPSSAGSTPRSTPTC